jgi:hypothetical protein
MDRIKPAACVVGAVAALSLLARWTEKTTGGYDTGTAKVVKRLIGQCKRWDVAARQDSDPLIALTHCNYAIAYLEIATLLLPEAEVERCTGENVTSMHFDLEKHQSALMAALGTQGQLSAAV